ncbi:endocytosis defective-related protein [Rhizina undulata]
MSRKPISKADIDKYWEIFSYHTNGGTRITGDQAFSILKNSGLSDDKLAKIWDLADVDSDGQLDFEEFCVAMRLIFDCVNGEYKEVPKKLPDFLVPESKAHLIAASNALSSDAPQFEKIDDDEDDTPGLKDGFDWYMSPGNKSRYEGMYMASAGEHGQLSFNALDELYNEISVPDTDIRNAWNLVNPSKDPTIGKDQALIFLHILANRHEGFRIPRSVPASLRASFEKNKIDYNLDNVKAPSFNKLGSGRDLTTISGKKAAFGESYLTRLGIGGRGYNHTGTDFSASKDQDWEEVRLKRQLADLESKIAETEAAAERRRNRGKYGAGGSKAALVKREVEQMLEYKRRELRELDEVGGNSKAGANLNSVREDLEMVKEQVEALDGHLRKREEVLQDLMREVEEEKTRR